MVLIVPQPQLSQDDAEGTQFGEEKPINLVCEPVKFPDGTVLTLENVIEFGSRLYRLQSGGVTEVWDEAEQRWIASSAPVPEPQPMFRKEDKWQSLIVGIGQKEKSTDNPKFGTQRSLIPGVPGFPQYFFRCFFKGLDAQGVEHVGESPNSEAVEIYPFGDRNRAGLIIKPKSKPPSKAKEICLFLKDADLKERGQVVIQERSGEIVVELAANGATITIGQSGDIGLKSAPGRFVRVEGNFIVNGDGIGPAPAP